MTLVAASEKTISSENSGIAAASSFIPFPSFPFPRFSCVGLLLFIKVFQHCLRLSPIIQNCQ